MDWLKHLETLMKTTISPIVMSGEEPRALNRWLIKKVQGHRPDRLNADPAIDPAARVLLPWDLPLLSQAEIERNWRPYISERADRYLEVNEPFELFDQVDESSYMYACCSVHCLQDREMYVNMICYFPSPVRVWINGQLVIAAHSEYINREICLRVPFHEGFNIILVEAPLHLDRQLTEREFIVKISPLDRLTDQRKQAELIDPEWLEHLKQACHLVLDNCIVDKNEEEVPVLEGMVQPLCFLPESLEKTYVLEVRDSQGNCIAQQSVEATNLFHKPFPNDAQGFYRITLTDPDNRTASVAHCCIGNIEEEAIRLIERIKSRKDCNPAVLEALRTTADVPSIMRSLNQYVPTDWMQQNLKAFYEASVYADSPDKGKQADLPDVFPERYSVVQPKSIDLEEVICTVHLPEQYDRHRRYPVVFYFHDAQGRKYPTPLPWMQWSRTNEAIIVDLVGISRKHFADDIQVVRTINNILETLPADRDRLYGIGFCTGAPKSYRVAFLVPHLFAAVASIIGDARIDAHQPEYEYFDNLQHTAVFAVCGVENWFFNSMRKADFVDRVPLGETWMVHGFIHNESNTLFNSKQLLSKLLQVKRNPLPRSVKHTLIDPAFNHSYWVDGIQAVSLQHTLTYLHAHVRSRTQVDVRTRNVRQFRLLLAQDEMELDNEITLVVNDQAYPIKLSSAYTALSFLLAGSEDACKQHWEITTRELDNRSFMKAMNRIADEDERLGIKRTYVRNCVIVKPDRKQDPRRTFHMKLSFLLQNPIRDRYIAYKLDSCSVQEWADGEYGNRAYVHLLDMRNLHDSHKLLLEQLRISAAADAITFQHQSYTGEYAAVILAEAGPSDHLLVAYNSEAAGEALLALWNTFDDNPLFYEQAIIWHEGQWLRAAQSEKMLVT